MNSKKKQEGKNPTKQKTGLMFSDNSKRNQWIAFAIIATVTLLLYRSVFTNEFVSLDDEGYIQKQPLIHSFDFSALFSQFVGGNYHPLVMLVYTVIYHFFNLNATAYHTVNLIIHILNAGLVLILIQQLSGNLKPAFIVSLLFAIHPLHVESVAWASELKDVMYGFGFLAALFFYIQFVKGNKSLALYLYSILFFIFSLFSKGMAVSLTAVLFLVDFYLNRKFSVALIIEKIPFIILSVIFGLLAIKAQHETGAIQEISDFDFTTRLVFACYGFVIYLVRLFIPLNLSAHYPYPIIENGSLPAQYYLFVLVFVAILIFTILSLKKNKLVVFGIGFYTATVILVLQILPVGQTITADRYTYISSIGFLFLIAQLVIHLLSNKKIIFLSEKIIPGLLIIYFLFLSFQTINRVKIWNNSFALWNNVIENYPEVYGAYVNRGIYYKDHGDMDKAKNDFEQSLKINHKNPEALNNLGSMNVQLWLSTKNEAYIQTAVNLFNEALAIDPNFANAYANRGGVNFLLGKHENAISDLSKCISLDSTDADSYYNRAIIYYNTGNKNAACIDLKKSADLGFEKAVQKQIEWCR